MLTQEKEEITEETIGHVTGRVLKDPTTDASFFTLKNKKAYDALKQEFLAESLSCLAEVSSNKIYVNRAKMEEFHKAVTENTTTIAGETFFKESMKDHAKFLSRLRIPVVLEEMLSNYASEHDISFTKTDFHSFYESRKAWHQEMSFT